MARKTRKALTKRIKVTASGKIKRVAVGGRHLKVNKSANQKRRSKKKKVDTVSKGQWKAIKDFINSLS